MDSLRPCRNAACSHLANPGSHLCAFHDDYWPHELEDPYDESSNADSTYHDNEWFGFHVESN